MGDARAPYHLAAQPQRPRACNLLRPPGWQDARAGDYQRGPELGKRLFTIVSAAKSGAGAFACQPIFSQLLTVVAPVGAGPGGHPVSKRLVASNAYFPTCEFAPSGRIPGDVPTLSAEADRGAGVGYGRLQGPQANPPCRRPDHAGDRRDRRRDRRRHLRRHRHGGRRSNRSTRRSHPDRRGPRIDLLVPALGRRLRVGGALLCGAGIHDSPGRQCVRLLLRDARRDRRLDHRLGPHSGVRGGQRGGGHFLGRLFQHALARIRGDPALLDLDRLSPGAAQRRPPAPRNDRYRAAHRRDSHPGRPAGLRHRDAHHLAAAPRGAGKRHRQQHHGRHQAGGAVAVRGGRRDPLEGSQLPSVRPQRFHPQRFHRHPPGRGDCLLRVYRLRRDFHRRRGDLEPAAQPPHRHPGRPRHLHRDLHDRGSRAHRHGALQGTRGGRSAGARARADRIQGRRLDRRAGRYRIDVRRVAGVSVRPAAHLLRHGPRWPVAAVGGQDSSAHAHPLGDHAADRDFRGAVVAGGRRRGDLRSDQHRHLVRIYPGQPGRAGSAIQGAGEAQALQGPAGLARERALGGRLPVPHERSSGRGVGAFRLLAGNRPGAVLRVRIQAQRPAPLRHSAEVARHNGEQVALNRGARSQRAVPALLPAYLGRDPQEIRILAERLKHNWAKMILGDFFREGGIRCPEDTFRCWPRSSVRPRRFKHSSHKPAINWWAPAA
ncbi:hypothetical protein SBA4_4130004 [Candidatus Sulfopaludibacter sp. SbA4]|nr:hypothetical protein SBA4_4130004 [Candidatus Sulfopaludibacter sp. SbA4]